MVIRWGVERRVQSLRGGCVGDLPMLLGVVRLDEEVQIEEHRYSDQIPVGARWVAEVRAGWPAEAE